jgi:hypothetical protein
LKSPPHRFQGFLFQILVSIGFQIDEAIQLPGSGLEGLVKFLKGHWLFLSARRKKGSPGGKNRQLPSLRARFVG